MTSWVSLYQGGGSKETLIGPFTVEVSVRLWFEYTCYPERQEEKESEKHREPMK